MSENYQRLQIKHKYLAVRTKQKALPNSDISGLEPKIPLLQLGHMQSWLAKVLFWLSDFETDN